MPEGRRGDNAKRQTPNAKRASDVIKEKNSQGGTSTRFESYYKELHRRGSVSIEPRRVSMVQLYRDEMVPGRDEGGYRQINPAKRAIGAIGAKRAIGSGRRT